MIRMLKPVTGGIRSPLAMIIAMGESSPNTTEINYNIHNSSEPGAVNSSGKIYTRYFSRRANLSNLSLAELASVHGDGKTKYRAVGRWQILPAPMTEFKKWAKLGGGVQFTNHVQDCYVAYALLVKRKAIGAFLLDNNIKYGAIYASSSDLKRKANVIFKAGYGVPSAEYAACCLAMEWSSKPMPNGQTFYSNGVDKAHVKFLDVVKALQDAKVRVSRAISRGIVDDLSLIWVALGGSAGEVGAIDLDIKRNGDFHKYDSKAAKITDIRSTHKVKGKLSSSTVDNSTARAISDAHDKAGLEPLYARKAKHSSIIAKKDASIVSSSVINGVNVVTYSDGTISARGVVEAKGGFKLSKRSLSNLEGVHPSLVRVVHRAIEITGQDFAVTEGVRTLERQKKLFAEGKSKTMQSKHLVQADGFSHAVDLVAASPVDWKTVVKYLNIADAMSIAAREMNVRIRWGGSWTDISVPGFKANEAMTKYANAKRAKKEVPFLDLVHFELIL